MNRRLRLLVLCGLLLAVVAAGVVVATRPRGTDDRLYAAALDAAHQGDLSTAGETLEKAVLAQPEKGAYHADLGVVYLQRGDAARAIPELQAAAFLSPDHPHVYCRLAQALVEEHRRADAMSALAIALRKTPDCPIALAVRGEQLLRDDNLTGALADFQRVLQLDPDSPLAYEKTGYIHLSSQKPDEAIAVLLKGLEKNPSHPGLHALLGSAYARHPEDPHSAALAEQHLRLAIPRNPDSAKVYATLGQLYLATGKTKEAGESFGEALKRSPYLKDALYGMAQVAKKEGRADEAGRYLATFNTMQAWFRELSDLQAQATARPKDVPVRLKIGRKLMGKNLDKEALKTLDEAVTADPAVRAVRELRAEAYRRLGQFAKAADESAVANLLPVRAS